MTRLVTVTESILVRAPRERVWDWTQDWSKRATWDRSVREASIVTHAPLPRVRVRGSDGTRAVAQYKLFERPERTSLVLEEVESAWIDGGGGSWSYEARGEGTWWTQTNALRLRAGFWRALLAPIVRAQLRSSTRKAMRRAKRMIEQDPRRR